MIVIDPVCGMKLKSNKAVKYEYKGKFYHFCDISCETEFKSNPEKYLK